MPSSSQGASPLAEGFTRGRIETNRLRQIGEGQVKKAPFQEHVAPGAIGIGPPGSDLDGPGEILDGPVRFAAPVIERASMEIGFRQLVAQPNLVGIDWPPNAATSVPGTWVSKIPYADWPDVPDRLDGFVVQPDGLGVAFDRRVLPALFLEGQRPTEHGLGVPGIEPHGFVEGGSGSGELTARQVLPSLVTLAGRLLRPRCGAQRATIPFEQ